MHRSLFGWLLRSLCTRKEYDLVILVSCIRRSPMTQKIFLVFLDRLKISQLIHLHTYLQITYLLKCFFTVITYDLGPAFSVLTSNPNSTTRTRIDRYIMAGLCHSIIHHCTNAGVRTLMTVSLIFRSEMSLGKTN